MHVIQDLALNVCRKVPAGLGCLRRCLLQSVAARIDNIAITVVALYTGCANVVTANSGYAVHNNTGTSDMLSRPCQAMSM